MSQRDDPAARRTGIGAALAAVTLYIADTPEAYVDHVARFVHEHDRNISGETLAALGFLFASLGNVLADVAELRGTTPLDELRAYALSWAAYQAGVE